MSAGHSGLQLLPSYIWSLLLGHPVDLILVELLLSYYWLIKYGNFNLGIRSEGFKSILLTMKHSLCWSLCFSASLLMITNILKLLIENQENKKKLIEENDVISETYKSTSWMILVYKIFRCMSRFTNLNDLFIFLSCSANAPTHVYLYHMMFQERLTPRIIYTGW